jgi:hypothetical protein
MSDLYPRIALNLESCCFIVDTFSELQFCAAKVIPRLPQTRAAGFTPATAPHPH